MSAANALLADVRRIRREAAQQFVENAPQRVYVVADFRGTALQLPGAHVGKRAAGLPNTNVRFRVRQPRNPEIRQARCARLVHQDVVRFDVTVDDTFAVRVRQCIADRQKQPCAIAPGSPGSFPNVGARQGGHRVEVASIIGKEIQGTHDGGMHQRLRNGKFTPE